MDDRPQPASTTGQFTAADSTRQPEAGPPAGHPAPVSAQPLKDARTADVTLTSDGELIEAGYGHGV